MSYEVFQRKVNALINKAGFNQDAKFSCDDEGIFLARCPQGVTLTGNSVSLSVTVLWGSRNPGMFGIHQSIVII